MRIAVVCNDTRGGVQPYVALGLGLRGAGHDVRLVGPAHAAGLVGGSGLPLVTLSGDDKIGPEGPAGLAEKGTLAAMRYMARELPRQMAISTRETLAACEGMDMLTGGIGGMVTGLAVAEKLGVPFVETHLQPVGFPTNAYPGVMVSRLPRLPGGWGWWLGHHLSEAAMWMPFRGAMNAAREKTLGLTGPPRRIGGMPVLYGFSRHVVPMPDAADGGRVVTGYWTLPAPPEWTLPVKLETFLAWGGAPVVSIGFGSMTSGAPAALAALVLDAVRRAGVRAVLLAGWGGIGALADAAEDVFCLDGAPHDWLFARVAACVHHGGAGTTGAGLRAGIPGVVVPFAVDQPFWGGRVAALGAGPEPIPRKRLTAARLAEALRVAVGDDAMRARAAALGERIRAEDGIGNAVERFGRLRVAASAASKPR